MKKIKKFLNLISLLILISSNIFSPLNYVLADSEEILNLISEEETSEDVNTENSFINEEDYVEKEDSLLDLEDEKLENDNKTFSDENYSTQEEILEDSMNNGEWNDKFNDETWNELEIFVWIYVNWCR